MREADLLPKAAAVHFNRRHVRYAGRSRYI